MLVQIIILVMIAAFLGLRLYSVLGRRAEHEEEPVPTRLDAGEDATSPRAIPAQATGVGHRAAREITGYPPSIERGLREIAAADRRFDVHSFVEGAKAAYAMILEAFWRGDKEELAQLCEPEVYDDFVAAIDAREAAGETFDNRLVRIEDTTITAAALEDGSTARITVRFVADIAAVTRDRDGVVVAGSLNDAVESRDLWTFSRDVRSAGPDWLLVATDVD